MPRKVMRDVVVCIPGITGSVLQKDGRDVWNISGGALISALTTFGHSITDLKLEQDPPDVDDLGDGITAPEVIRDVHLLPGFWKIDGYTKMLRYIEETFDVERGANLFEFPYDWRRDNRVAARRLQRQAGEWLTKWRASSGAQDAKLVLVGHSMGGLVSRYYLECLDGWRNTRALVSFGTPFRGSLNSLDTLVNGKKIKFFDLTDVARSFTAIYQLLPTYPCYVEGGAEPAYVDEADIPHLDRAKAKAALDFHREIRDAVDAHLEDQAYMDGRYDLGRIVGINQPTQQSAVRDGDRIRLSRTIRGQDPRGDGTVPRPSARTTRARRSPPRSTLRSRTTTTACSS
jgi:pimeloyl-ACP methyl ester carboxylesterase